jgi:predicted RNase H-like HicB family nuclease
MARTFHVIIEQDEDGGYVGKVPELRGCLSQGDTIDELMGNIKEAIELCLEVQSEEKSTVAQEQIRFVGVQEIIAYLFNLGTFI